MNLASIAAAILATASLVSSKIYFSESFDNDNWQSTWKVPSKNENNLGSWEISSGKFHADPRVSRGLRTLNDLRFYALTAPFSEPFNNEKGDLVVQFSAKNEQNLNCGGAYIKLLSSDVNVDEFSGQTPYKIMFGPDVCGSNRRVHLILERGGEGRMIKEKVDFTNDDLTHMYTLVISQPEQTYRILIDGAEVAKGSIAEDVEEMTTVPPMIPDPSATKPDDWVDEATIEDPEDKKPEDWDENENWSPRLIPNPAYKGQWTAPLIPNPAYKPDPTLAVYKDLAHLGFDLWQVNSGTIFDNILVTDDFSEAQRAIDTLFTPFKELEEAARKAFFATQNPSEEMNTNESSEENDAANTDDANGEDQLESDTNEHTDL